MMVSVVYSEGQVIVEFRGDVRLGIEGRGTCKGMLQKPRWKRISALTCRTIPLSTHMVLQGAKAQEKHGLSGVKFHSELK